MICYYFYSNFAGKGEYIMAYPFENSRINANIRTGELFKIRGMADYYLAVTFRYTAKTWNGAIPIRSKYQAIEIPLTLEDVRAWTLSCYSELDPGKYKVWRDEQQHFWESKEAFETQAVFDALNGEDSLTKWQCRKCGPVPQSNPQPAARIKALKQMGYYIATIQKDCATCGGKQYFDLLIRLPRNPADNERRFAISVSLQNKIKNVLPQKDACFDSPQPGSELIIDHKFPSSRWVNGETVNATSMSSDEIKDKFQLLTNQTNLQKERYCNRCVASGIRGDFFGIKWFYAGDERWRGTSKADEKGCIGCCWYDLTLWKEKFNEFLLNAKSVKDE